MRPENRELLGPRDVVLATHPGSGTSWVSTLLVHLGIFFVSGENELLVDATSQRTRGWVDDDRQRLPGTPASGEGGTFGARAQREHLVTLAQRDRRSVSYREPVRVIKTNHSAIGWRPEGKVLLLVRDGRDTLLSLYHNQRSFSGLDVELADYLAGNGGAWPLPALSWAVQCTSWLAAVPVERLHVLRFESARERPVGEFGAMLRFLGVEREPAELEHAIAESSYDRMREVESAAIEERGARIGRERVMRKGKVGEWRDVYTEQMLRSFQGLPRRALQAFGYPLDGIPEGAPSGGRRP